MNIFLECKKIKRTGFVPACLGGAVLAASIPILTMAFRFQTYQSQAGSPLEILLRANWQMMAMLHVLFVVTGACLLYQTEYTDRAMEKLYTLPIRESAIFFDKVILAVLASLIVLAAEAASIAFCSYYWFSIRNGFWNALGRQAGSALVLLLPCIVLSLLIAQACKNMWVSLGICVVCVFTAVMIPTNHPVLSLFPFALPFQICTGADGLPSPHHLAAGGELLLFAITELVFLKVRRSLS